MEVTAMQEAWVIFFMFWSTCINLCTKKYMLLPQSLSFSVFVLCLALTKKQMGENTTFTAQYEYAAFNWWRTRQLLWWWVMKPQRSGGSSTYRETEKGLFMLETEESIAKKNLKKVKKRSKKIFVQRREIQSCSVQAVRQDNDNTNSQVLYNIHIYISD